MDYAKNGEIYCDKLQLDWSFTNVYHRQFDKEVLDIDSWAWSDISIIKYLASTFSILWNFLHLP